MSKHHTNKLQNLICEFSNLAPFIPILTLTLTTTLIVANLRTLPSSASDSVVSEISVTVQPSCTLTNESDLGSSSNSSIKTLQPGTYDPNIHTITLTSNCNDVYDSQIFAIGYTGCNGNNDDDCLASNANTNLVGQTSGAIISGLTPFPTDGETDPTSFTTSGWYMKVSPNSTDTWQFTPENNFNTFRTIPSTSTLIAKTTITTNQITKPTSTLTTTYSAYASPSQIADTYEGKVKYTLITSKVTFPYIQDLTLDQCKVNVGTNGNPENIGDNLTVIDIRDGNDYTVRYINGYCWMTQNLRITGIIKAEYSNFTGADFNVSAYDLADPANKDASGPCYSTMSNNVYSGAGFTNACSHKSDDVLAGAWYNYAAATAGTIKGLSDSSLATSDICPSNWHLPSGPGTQAGTDFNKLIGQTLSNGLYYEPTDGVAAFGTSVNGIWINGEFSTISPAEYVSTSASNVTHRYALYVNSGNGRFMNYHNWRSMGTLVRCVRTN